VVSAPVAQPEIPAELQAVLIKSLGIAQDKAAADLRREIDESNAREAEALEGLAEAEKQISILTAQVAEIRQLASEKDQAADKAIAVAAEKIESMAERIQALEIERRQLIESAEASRTEAAKALMQVERADQATAKAEDRLQALDVQVVECNTRKVEAEKYAAVAEQRSVDLIEQLTETRETLSETKSESKALSVQLSKEIKELREANKSLEIKIAGFAASAGAVKTSAQSSEIQPQKKKTTTKTGQ
jgi:chromosome segregation ATPase